jgi:hypothetical protein
MNANGTSIVEGGAHLGKTKRVDSNGASNTKSEIGGYFRFAATKIFGKRISADAHSHPRPLGGAADSHSIA